MRAPPVLFEGTAAVRGWLIGGVLPGSYSGRLFWEKPGENLSPGRPNDNLGAVPLAIFPSCFSNAVREADSSHLENKKNFRSGDRMNELERKEGPKKLHQPPVNVCLKNSDDYAQRNLYTLYIRESNLLERETKR